MDLDAILDQALDDFDDQEISKQAKEVAEASKGLDEERKAEETRRKNELLKMMDSMKDPEHGSSLQSTLKQLSGTSEGVESVDSLFKQLSEGFETAHKDSYLPDGPNDIEGIEKADAEVAKTLQMVGSAQQGMEGFEAGKMEAAGEDMMEEMMAQFEALGDKEDYNEVIDGVMRQLLSKDMMYDPTKQVCDKFPEWLAIHKAGLSEPEYNNYGRQYQSFQKILAVYDTEPDNFPRLMELMFDMQQYGQPPADLIKDLAPGLKFDENGMPIMPNMGAGMMPDMPGGEGLPNLAEMSGNMAQGQCSIS